MINNRNIRDVTLDDNLDFAPGAAINILDIGQKSNDEGMSDCSIGSHKFYHDFDYTVPFNEVLKFKYKKGLTDMITGKFAGYSQHRDKNEFQRRKIRALYGYRSTLNI